MDRQHVDIGNARVDEQRDVMQQIITDGVCPFCRENLSEYHKLPILKETEHWLLTNNQWPYKHTKHHFLAIYKEHVEHLSGLEPQAGAELLELAQWLEAEHSFPGGGLVMRFGDTKHSAGTVLHIHAQLLVPDVDHPNYMEKPVRVKIGSTNRN